jgi:hypothetical protein
MYFLLICFLFIGLTVGYTKSIIELKNCTHRIPNKSMINYWLGK